jgi:hypothetical protein
MENRRVCTPTYQNEVVQQPHLFACLATERQNRSSQPKISPLLFMTSHLLFSGDQIKRSPRQMKRTALHFFAIAIVLTIVCTSANAEPVFSVTHAIRDVGVDLAAHAIHQQTGIQTVPEPSTILLLGTAVTGLLGLRSRRKNRK